VILEPLKAPRESARAIGLTISGQIRCDDLSQCLNIAAKDSCWLTNFPLLKKVEVVWWLLLLTMAKLKLSLLYKIILWAIAHVLGHSTTTFHGTKALGELCEPLRTHDDLEGRNHGSRSERSVPFPGSCITNLSSFSSEQWH
jgi:hypothetical protein